MEVLLINAERKGIEHSRGDGGYFFSSVPWTAFSGNLIYSSLIENAFWMQEKIFAEGMGGSSEGVFISACQRSFHTACE